MSQEQGPLVASDAAQQPIKAQLSADTPVESPDQDAFQYGAFAKTLAKAVMTTPSPKGVVMALHGPWGSGKSSLLNLVKYHLEGIPDGEPQPLIIEFNPWWFNGREQLAGQLLTQFHKALFRESELLRDAGDLLAKYAGTISKAVTVSTGIPALDWVAKPFLKMLGRQPVDVPKMKEMLSESLTKAGKRILIIIDDIDRLTPAEMMEVFKVVKALGDFPNVLYLLSFDRGVVSKAIGKEIKGDGAAYLEKIVQASFGLPAVGREQLNQKLFTEIDSLLAGLPNSKTERAYFHNVYFDGLQQYIEKPRDVVRIINVLHVTYPGIAGEVNWVDFFALEFMRVFEPLAYQTIRDRAHMFMGFASFSQRTETLKRFHEGWLKEIPEPRRAGVQALVIRIFPKVKAALKNHIDEYSDHRLHHQLRLCCTDFMSIYFSFGVPDSVLSRAEGDRFIELAAEPDSFVERWIEARNVIRPDGHSKAADILKHLSRLPASTDSGIVKQIFKALLAVPGEPLIPGDNGDIPILWLVNSTLMGLLELVPEGERSETLREALAIAQAIGTSMYLVHTLLDLRDNPEHELLPGVEGGMLEELKALVLLRMRNLDLNSLLSYPQQQLIIANFANWASEAEAKAHYLPILQDASLLACYLENSATVGSMHVAGDRITQRMVRIAADTFDLIASSAEVIPHVQALLDSDDLSEFQRAVAEEYIRVTEVSQSQAAEPVTPE